MKQLAPLEDAIVKVHKDLPHLPKGLTTWVVDNAWWLAIIGVALGGIGVLTTLTGLVAGSLFLGAIGGAALGATVFLSGIISLAVLVLTIVLEAMAIRPLKAKQKRGWDLMFLASLVGLAGLLLSALLGGPIGIVAGILWAAIVAALSFYVLFELRGHYLVHVIAPEKK